MAVPKWLDGKTPQERGRRFEKKLAKKIGGQLQPASGALPGMKEDIRTQFYLIQAKSTTKRQYTLKLDDLEALMVNATKVGKQPMMVLKMGRWNWAIQPTIEL